jgi:hypothetical protein
MNWREKVFEPEYAFPLAYLVFLFSAFLAYKIPVISRFLIRSFSTPPSLAAYLVSLLGIFVVISSVKLGRRIEKINRWPMLAGVFITTSAVVYLTLNIHILLAILMGGGYAVLLYYLSTQGDFNRLTNLVFLLALLSAFSILVRGIPILSASAREATAVSTSRALFHGFGVFAGVLLIGFYDRRRAVLAVAVLAFAGILSGFKSDAIAIILSAAIAGILLQKITFRTASIAIVAIAFILTVVSTYIAWVAHGVWNIPPYFYPFYRFGFTFSVYSKIVDLAYPFGALGGRAILNTTQEIVSTAVLGYSESHIITSSLFGPLTLDFGVIGTVLTALFVGLYLGAFKKDTTLKTCLYAMALTHVLVLIEVGLQLSSIMFLLSMLYLSVSEKSVSVQIPPQN